MEMITPEHLNRLLPSLESTIPSTPESIAAVETSLRTVFPDDYKSFLLVTNGYEGKVGAHGYIQIWPDEELVEANEGYGMTTCGTSLVLFATDGGGTAYAFDYAASSTAPPILEIGFPFCRDNSRHFTESFSCFLIRIASDE